MASRRVVWPSASDIMRAVPRKAKPEGASAILLALLAAFLVLAGLPDDRGGVRVAGVSLLWWYGGLVGPVLAVAVALLWGGRSRGASDAGAGPPPAR